MKKIKLTIKASDCLEKIKQALKVDNIEADDESIIEFALNFIIEKRILF